MGDQTPSAAGLPHRSSGYGTVTKTVRTVAGIALLALAALALAGGIRLIILDRLPDGTLSLASAVALGTCGAVWLLIERRIAASRRTARVTQ